MTANFLMNPFTSLTPKQHPLKSEKHVNLSSVSFTDMDFKKSSTQNKISLTNLKTIAMQRKKYTLITLSLILTCYMITYTFWIMKQFLMESSFAQLMVIACLLIVLISSLHRSKN